MGRIQKRKKMSTSEDVEKVRKAAHIFLVIEPLIGGPVFIYPEARGVGT